MAANGGSADLWREPDPEPLNPSLQPAGEGGRRSDLSLRVASALVMAPAAILFAWLGGWWFLLFWLAAACAIFWEWTSLAAPPGEPVRPAVAGGAGLALAALGYAAGYPVVAAAALVAGYAVAAGPLGGRRAWIAGGMAYSAALLFAPVVLRNDASYGLAAILLLFAVVWSTDIAAYFGGRLIGGPKLWPSLSPNKTWSGAVIGALAGTAAGIFIGWGTGISNLFGVGMIAAGLSVAAQAGDLFESAVKRHFGAKDASRLIPGHGGLMDRLDGFVAAAFLAVLIGVARGGLEAPSAGLMIW